MWRRPKVHSGFDKAWRNKQLSQRVLGKIQELFETGQVEKKTCHFVITGEQSIRKKQTRALPASAPLPLSEHVKRRCIQSAVSFLVEEQCSLENCQ